MKLKFASLVLPVFVLSSLIILNAGKAVSPENSHNPGTKCSECHLEGSNWGEFAFGGTVFSDSEGSATVAGRELILQDPEGATQSFTSDTKGGNIYSPEGLVKDGIYLMTIDGVSSKTWHSLPEQKDCNTCHIVGGNGNEVRTKVMTPYHTRVLTLKDGVNDCSSCHHYPGSMLYSQLGTSGVLQSGKEALTHDEDWVEILGVAYDVEYSDFVNLQTQRPDIFRPGYFSAFDVILAVAEKHGHQIEYEWDEDAMTHWITSVDGVEGEYWYKWNNDNGIGADRELYNCNRQNRWDEFIYREGTKVALIDSSARFADSKGNQNSVSALRERYRAEIDTLNAHGGQAICNVVQISCSPSGYTAEQGMPDKNLESPSEAERFDIAQTYYDVPIVAHNLRAGTEGSDPVIGHPFQPGVLTTMDIVMSLEDAGLVEDVGMQYFDRIARSLTRAYWFQSITLDGKTTHASGSNGFVYRSHLLAEDNLDGYTGFNSDNLNHAAGSMHLPQDLYVMHDHDYCFIRWMEIGPGTPYYEAEDPGIAEEIMNSDWEARDLGFNLRPAYPNPFSETCLISFNIFDPEVLVDLSIYDMNGRIIEKLYHNQVEYVGEHLFRWQPEDLASGTYFLVMKYGDQTRTTALIYSR